MLSALLIGMALTVALPELSREDQANYDSARGRAGNNPEANVELALWCEAHGLQAERMKHLEIARLADPNNARARGLLGLVEHDGRWEPADTVSKAIGNDASELARQAGYRVQRDRTPETADGQWKLALWCEANGLREAAKGHLIKVVRLDPKREAAWKRLGYRLQGGRWSTPEQLAAERHERELQKQADRQWKSHFEKWRGWLANRQKQSHAVEAMATVTDPRAVPMAWLVFATGGTENQKVAVQLLSQIDAPGASRALALLAILSRSAEVRRMATENLLRRDPREFAGPLVAMIREPIKYEVKRPGGPGSAGEILIQSKEFDYKRRYTSLPAPQLMPGERFAGFDDFGLPVASMYVGWYTPQATPGITSSPIQGGLGANQIADALAAPGVSQAKSAQLRELISGAQRNAAALWGMPGDSPPVLFGDGTGNDRTIVRVEVDARIPIGQQALDAQRSSVASEEKLNRDIRDIEASNDSIHALNSRLLGILTRVAGQDFGEDPEGWQKWHTDLLGYAIQAQAASREKTTVVEEVPSDYQAQAAPVSVVAGRTVFIRTHACFAAGTPVRTLSGLTPIEAIRAGDRVLSQDTKTGTLSFPAVATVYHNPPNTTLKIDLGNEPVVATKIHRFWVVGKGWTMARELKPGDSVRTLGGTAVVKAVTEDRTQPVFNLELVDGDSFFVGEQGTLVHDNSVVRPVTEAFDASAALAAPKVAK